MIWILMNTVLGFIFCVIFIANMSSDLRPSSTALAWLTIIFFFPVFGMPLYLIFGGRKLQDIVAKKPYLYPRDYTKTRAHPNIIEKVLAFHYVPATTEHNQISIIAEGEQAYRSLLSLIEQAQESIEIQTYIIGNDEVGDAILDHLIIKAKAGVAVRLLIDGLFAFVYPKGKIKKLRKAGIDVRLFLPLRFRLFRSRINLRNHRKLVIVDRRLAIMGGMNLAKNYMGPVRDQHRWCDIAVRLEGESVAELAKFFCSDWLFATKQHLEKTIKVPVTMTHSSAIQVVASGPDVLGDPFYNTLLTAIYNAKESIAVVTPYFVPDIALYKALALAVFRGVNVTVIIPKHSNHPIADLARCRHVRYLMASGVNILFFEPTMLHAKVVTVDEEIAIVGSANFDMRSLFFNFESCVYLYSVSDIVQIKNWVDSLKGRCSNKFELPDPSRARLILENLASLISPLL